MNYYDDKIKICMSQFYIQFTLRTDASLVSVANNDSGNLNELEALRLGRALLFVADALFGAARLNIDTLAIFNRLPKTEDFAFERVLLAKIASRQNQLRGEAIIRGEAMI